MTPVTTTETIARIMATGYNRHVKETGPGGSYASEATESGDGYAVLVERGGQQFSVRVERLPARTADAPKTPGQCWAALKAEITRDAETEQELGDGYSDKGTEEGTDSANRHWNRAEALREVLEAMDRLASDQGEG